ncbi:MAG: hypothetical protein RL641_420 [Candidatus Parcubacteria bacterium]|jgi:protein-disulfide isomerase
MTKEAKILITMGVIAIVGGVLLSYTQPKVAEPSAPVDGTLLIREGSHMKTTKDAKVQIVEFGDYQCPACGAAHPVIKKIIADYKDNPNVNFVFRNFPLPGHANARSAAEAAEAAGAQGKFWEMHDMLYEKQDEWSEIAKPIDIYISYATALGLDVDAFTKSVKSSTFSDVIRADRKDGDDVGVNATPTFYVNGLEFGNGVPAYDDLKAKIESLLKAQ